MEGIIRIGRPSVSFNIDLNPNASEDYQKWKMECFEKIGYVGDYYLLPCLEEGIEFAWKGERLYYRKPRETFFNGINSKVFPAIICECGQDEFQAAYGNYSLSLKCKCGKSDVVYEG